MHRCLLIQEVLRIICTHVGTLPRRNLLAVALVCRHFFDPSMDSLWHEVPTFPSVLKWLPSDIWRVPLTHRGIAGAALARAITPADLGRFKIYAHRVRVFINFVQIPADIYQALNFAFKGQPIFPNLVEFNQNSDGISYIGMLLGPCIRKIALSLTSNPAQTSLLPLLGGKYPALARFILKTEYNPDLGRQINHVLLELARADVKFGDTFSPVPNCPNFPVLQKLSVTANSLTLCINLLRAATNCPLQRFIFHLYEEPAPDWHNLFSALAKSCNKVTLKMIFTSDSRAADEWETPGTTDQLRPLLLFTNLTHVYFTTRYGFNVDDTFMREMAAAWPRLQNLDIGPAKMHQPLEQQRLTLQGLVPLANLCPELRGLEVHVNATHLCFNHVNLGFNSSSSRVEYITVGCSPIGQSSVPWVVAYLLEVFPRLCKIHWTGPGNDEEDEERLAYPKRWQEVMNHLAAYRHIRGHQQDDLHCDMCN
ncbi:hypothetical protein BD779DRAFT_1722447 [Infundibulicybe gibba]|nr:hypothetical protein BD779DRAFT_1722447 [Infundibulicybe gibba]